MQAGQPRVMVELPAVGCPGPAPWAVRRGCCAGPKRGRRPLTSHLSSLTSHLSPAPHLPARPLTSRGPLVGEAGAAVKLHQGTGVCWSSEAGGQSQSCCSWRCYGAEELQQCHIKGFGGAGRSHGQPACTTPGRTRARGSYLSQLLPCPAVLLSLLQKALQKLLGLLQKLLGLLQKLLQKLLGLLQELLQKPLSTLSSSGTIAEPIATTADAAEKHFCF